MTTTVLQVKIHEIISLISLGMKARLEATFTFAIFPI